MNIEDKKWFQDFLDTCDNMYAHGWDERNGGNVSLLLSSSLASFFQGGDSNASFRVGKIDFDATELAGRYLLVTGSGKYFKNVKKAPSENVGVIKILGSGREFEIVWGLDEGGVPTSELPAHLMSHIASLKRDAENAVVIHTHATHLLAMTYTHPLNEELFTKTLWDMCTECLVVFPDGVAIIPWLVPGSNEIGKATAEKFLESRLVIWPFHGVYASGKNLDETFGLIETAEKAAEIWTIVQAHGGVRQKMTDENLKELAKAFGVTPRY